MSTPKQNIESFTEYERAEFYKAAEAWRTFKPAKKRPEKFRELWDWVRSRLVETRNAHEQLLSQKFIISDYLQKADIEKRYVMSVLWQLRDRARIWTSPAGISIHQHDSYSIIRDHEWLYRTLDELLGKISAEPSLDDLRNLWISERRQLK